MTLDRGVRALTLWRPWTTLVLSHGKDVENRPWSTNYRGALLIHGGQRFDEDAVHMAALDFGVLIAASPEAHPTGIVGIVKVVSVCSLAAKMTARFASPGDVPCDCGPWAFPGQHHWKLAEARAFAEPVPCNGRQQLWSPPPDLAAVIAGQVAAVTRGT